MSKKVDILIPVFNGLTYVVDCVESVLRYTDSSLYHLWLLDDCSDAKTNGYLQGIADQYDHVTLVVNDENQGFVKNCNIGFSKGRLEWCLLLNSDVIVTPKWLDSMLKCGESDEKIAGVNPLTNHASQINVPMYAGASFLAVNDYFSNTQNISYPDIVTGVGFCLMLRRSVINKLSLFDEIYGKGYCEESDLCMRLTTQGHRVVVAPSVYVYHKGGGTFTDRGERYKKNRKIFDQRWANDYQEQFKVFHQLNPLQKYRDAMESGSRWDPIFGLRQAYRNVRAQLQHRNYLNSIKACIRASYDIANTRALVYRDSDYRKFGQEGKLRVTYVLHNVTVAGGVLSVIQLVNQLIHQGVDAKIVALREYPEIYNWQLLTRPIIYKNVEELIKYFPESDIAVATHWTTASWVNKVVESKKSKKSAYFLQDYEPWFFPENKKNERSEVQKTYELVGNKIVKSNWLSGMLKTDGYETQKIRLGMNLEVFYPREVERSDKIRILSMARPRTPRRGYEDLLAALKILWKEVDKNNVEIVFFGEDGLKISDDFPVTDVGVISSQDALAKLYSSCDIYIDSSVFQGFGRPALEAMACGAACVVTNVGGVNEYAVNGENCLAIEPSNPQMMAESVKKLVEDKDLREQFVTQGLETAKSFCHRREGRETYEYFKEIAGKA